MRRPPSRRAGLALVVAAVLAVVAMATGASLLRTPPSPLLGAAPDGPPRVAGCDGEVPRRAPVATTSAALLTCPDRFDGRTVRILGEAVGDVLGRGSRRWVQVNDDAYAFAGPLGAHHRTLGTNSGVAVLLPPDVRPRTLGGPGTWGDRLEVTGTFRAAAPEDEGGPAVLADRVVEVAPGRRLPTPADPRLLRTASATALAAGLVWLEVLRHSRRTR